MASVAVTVTPIYLSADDAHWGPVRNEIAIVQSGGLRRLEVASRAVTNLVDADELSAPHFSPDGNRIAYVSGDDIRLIDREGSND